MARRKTRKFTDEERAIFLAGVSEGERRRQQFLNCLLTSNRQLWKHLVELDADYPFEGVVLPREFVKALIECCTKRNCTARARKLRGHLAHAPKDEDEALADVLAMLEGKGDE